MDGGDELFSGNRSDDGSGTPVQDEHAPASDAEEEEEEMRSEPRHSEDEGSDRERGARGGNANGVGSGSDRDEGGGADSDSEPERPRPADSDEDDDDKERSPPKRRGSTSDNEAEPKQRGSDSENEEESKQREQSDVEKDSDSEMPRKRKIESDEEEGEKDAGKEEEGQGKWKAVMNSDSEEEEEQRETKAEEGSDAEQKGAHNRRALDESEDEEEEDKPVKRKKAVLSDSEEENDKVKKRRAVSDDDDDNSDSDEGFQALDKSTAAKLRELGSDSEEEEDRMKTDGGKKDEKTLFGSDSDSGDEEKMIADIFGESGDEEEEEFTGFNQEELEADKKQAQGLAKRPVAEESDSDDDVDRGKDPSFMSDFDIMLAKKKAQSGRRRRHRDGGTFISDADDVVNAMITKMNEAAEEDRMLNSQKKPALKKLTLLPTVVMHLKKQDLKETFIDSGVMTAIKEWISPLPDKSLPALRIREELLRILQELPSVSQETLKHSGIGRAVMFLYKHPKESRPNKDLALKLINEWSRPIFGLSSNYKGMTREERQQRDLDQQIAPRRRLSSGGQTPRRDLEKVLTGEEKALRPGDPGFCARARVPMPSNKDYVVRPKWNVDMDTNRGPVKKGLSRVDKQMRRFADIRRQTKTGHAVKISVEGNRMPL
ncbi:protein IWS1 homolog [Chanos chanos]|uniref:Protein IWS1 homolog n=1 Tax=Chanos chanos TaxID=29144 RepID=A0A6J2VK22_CHACN|nr:protein IWS1 homolog [Chanos chanos]